MSAPPAITVIVPTRDRPDHLRACLAALEHQTASSFEVVVVDDGSRDARAIAALVATAPHARLLRADGSGPAAARNVGVSAAEAAVVCFTDDDCRPEAGWLDSMLATFDTGGEMVAAVAGPMVAGEAANVFSVASQVVTNHLTERSLDRDTLDLGFAPTSNLAVRTAAQRAVPFDERYPLAAGEDRDWCARFRAAGHRLTFAPTARVWHHQDLTFGSYWRQQSRYGAGAFRFHRGGRAGAGRQPVSFYTSLLGRGFREGVRVGCLVLVAQVATAWGLGREAIADVCRRR